MADLYVRHSLNSRKAIKINLALRQFIPLADQDGDNKWVLEIGTFDVDSNGDLIRPQIIHGVVESNIEKEVEKAVANICSVIDWSDFEDDDEAPRVSSFYPVGDNIPIDSFITMTLIDDLPSSGMDLSDMQVMLNNGVVDFDITDEIKVSGDPFLYKLKWLPPNITG